MHVSAIVLAAGRGRRMGQDKALLELGGRTSIQRVVGACVEGGAATVTVVRRAADRELPADVRAAVAVVRAARTDEMIESLRLAARRLPRAAEAVLVFPVDYALVEGPVVAAMVALLARGAAVALPLWQDRPGHPIGLARGLAPEIETARTLRDVVARDPTRVEAAPVDSPWILRDLDTPEDLSAARAWLEDGRSP